MAPITSRVVDDFRNEPILAEELPRLDDDNFVPVDPNFLRVSLIGRALFACGVLVLAVVVAVLMPSRSWIPLTAGFVLLVLTAASVAIRILEVRNIAYQVRSHDVSYRSGVLVKVVSTVPFVRVQHARISQGPVQRHFGIATLEVNSAGPDLHIHGLGTDTAERLKTLVVERAGDLVEEQ